ncbi:hypothetical protein, conserved [Babesia ovata]|uniref:Uncharacterized protein n=1 Tax=Babesia ovata TaxID=189622 RepID=A0A2H6K9K4_9APIC|nr:uncharacterized protein BOVATA_011640 [Babesia ovata]GBE59671.1 hypothetical protein, conserved [Babesia ovata]
MTCVQRPACHSNGIDMSAVRRQVRLFRADAPLIHNCSQTGPMQFDSLTRIPRNVKDAIDWLLALKGTDPEKNLKALGAAVHTFLADKPVGNLNLPALKNARIFFRDLMTQKALEGLWPANVMLERFNTPMDKSVHFKFFGTVDESDYENVVQARGVKPEEIAKDLGKVVDGCEKFLEKIKNPNKYVPTYSSEATWDASCAKDPEACAVIFVGIAPMLYTGLRSLRKVSHGESFKWVPFAKKNLGEVLKALGYKEPERRPNMSGSYVFKALENVKFQMLVTLYDLSGFWAFY